VVGQALADLGEPVGSAGDEDLDRGRIAHGG
jgi:hypothetical protein